jgi:hypothetical protein
MLLPFLLFAGICACVWADAVVEWVGKVEDNLGKALSIRSRFLDGCVVELISILAWRSTSLCSTFGRCGLSTRGHGESSAQGCHDYADHEVCYCGKLQGGADEAAARRVHWAASCGGALQTWETHSNNITPKLSRGAVVLLVIVMLLIFAHRIAADVGIVSLLLMH